MFTVLLRDGDGLFLLKLDHILFSNDTSAQRRPADILVKLGLESVAYQGSVYINRKSYGLLFA